MNRLTVESRLISFQIYFKKRWDHKGVGDRGYRILKKTYLKLETSFHINSIGRIRPLSNYNLLQFTKIMQLRSAGCHSSLGHIKGAHRRPFLDLWVIASFMIKCLIVYHSFASCIYLYLIYELPALKWVDCNSCLAFCLLVQLAALEDSQGCFLFPFVFVFFSSVLGLETKKIQEERGKWESNSFFYATVISIFLA